MATSRIVLALNLYLRVRDEGFDTNCGKNIGEKLILVVAVMTTILNVDIDNKKTECDCSYCTRNETELTAICPLPQPRQH